MNRHVRMACAALLLLSVEAATLLGQPFLKRRAFHRFSPDSSREKPRENNGSAAFDSYTNA
jgi:hypothetical protein